MLLLGFWRHIWPVGHILASSITDIASSRKIGVKIFEMASLKEKEKMNLQKLLSRHAMFCQRESDLK